MSPALNRPDDLLGAPVSVLVDAMRRRTLSPVDLFDVHAAELSRVDAILNGVIATRFGAARAEAQAAEARYAAGGDDLPPLLGVPCTIKEMLKVEGMPHTAGIPARRDVVGEADATVVQRLRAAGAVVLGVTNVPEGGMWMETHNRLFGRTANPWDPRRTPGGSSGGEGAMVAAGAAPFGIGSDVGGSIRIPAAFCGVYGHKPSGGLVPNTGHWPDDGRSGGMLTIGPLGRTPDDLWRVLRVIAGPDDRDHAARPWPLSDPATVDLRDVVVYPVPGNGRTRISAAMRKAVEDAADALVDAGARRGHLSEARLARGLEIYFGALMGQGVAKYADLLGDGVRIPIGREAARLLTGRSGHTLPAVVTAMAEQLTGAADGLLERAATHGRALQAELEAVLGPNGVLLHPPYSRTAPRHVTALARPFDFVCTGLFNALEFPSTVAPVGFDARGLPLAVQIIGARGRDHVTLAAAGALERQLGGWRRAVVGRHRPSPLAPLLNFRR